MKKVGLFFGSFNPIHIGHLIIANHIVEFTNLDEVWFVITPHSPFKKKSTLLADHHRYQMVELAIENYPKLKASKIEFGLPQPNYTINTLIHLLEKHPNISFNLIMGEDNLQSFHKWKNYDIILENHEIYAYPRVFKNKNKPKFDNHKKIHIIDAPIIELSSTFIRGSIKKSKNIKPLVNSNVWKYIDEMNFYKKTTV